LAVLCCIFSQRYGLGRETETPALLKGEEMIRFSNGRLSGMLAAVLIALAGPAQADLAVTANDSHTVNNNGVTGAAKNPPPDTVSIVDVSAYPPKVMAKVEVPTSVVGPPLSIAIARDESYAIVTAATKIDPQNPDKIVPDNRVTVIDLKATPPKSVQQVTAGDGAAGVSISPDGALALVANRNEGTVSIFAIKDKRLEPVGKLDLGNPKSSPSSVNFLPDGKTALLTRDGDSITNVLRVDGAKVTIDERPLTTALRPYMLDINQDGTMAAVGNMGRGDGDIDTVSLIDLKQTPFRTVQTFSVGHTPEGIKFSPDGKSLAVANVEGSTKPSNSPIYRDHGTLIVFAVEGTNLRNLAEAPIGRWSQGVAFSKDGRTILVGSMIDQGLNVFRWEDGKLTPGAKLDLGSGPAAIRTAWP
jgi:DNA-binding beta-propeller fold protein YncE